MDGDHLLLIETRPLDGQWFEGNFKNATYAARLADSADLLGVFQADPNSLQLLGVVSPSDGFQRTSLTNDPPVQTLVFPLAVGKKWESQTTVSGTGQGVRL